MVSIAFHSLASAKRLKARGLQPDQAEAIAEEMRSAHEASRDSVVTVPILEAKLNEFEARIESKLADVKVDILKWNIPFQIAQFGMIVGIIIKLAQ